MAARARANKRQRVGSLLKFLAVLNFAPPALPCQRVVNRAELPTVDRCRLPTAAAVLLLQPKNVPMPPPFREGLTLTFDQPLTRERYDLIVQELEQYNKVCEAAREGWGEGVGVSAASLPHSV
eukprot:365165-Chlamydomonas_euryale.AAC.8